MTSALAVGCAALAAALLVGPRARWPAGWSAPRVIWLVPSAAAALLVVPRAGFLVLVLALAAAAVAGLVRRQRARAAARANSLRVLETCEVMASELSAGRPAGECLDRAARAWSALAPVASAFRVGADVPGSMRDVATRLDGAGDLRIVAAAWQVGHRTGEGLAATIDRVAESLRATSATRRVVAGELASARATARLVAGLPVLALLMGSGAGGDPWGFLLRTPAGLACLAVGLGFGLAGLWWIEGIARGAEDGG